MTAGALLCRDGTKEDEVTSNGAPISVMPPRGGPTQLCGTDAVSTFEETSACRVDQPEE